MWMASEQWSEALIFQYAVDSDGDDSVVSQLNVTIGDDVQIMQDGTLDIVEPNLADGAVTTNTIDVMPNQSRRWRNRHWVLFWRHCFKLLIRYLLASRNSLSQRVKVYITLQGDIALNQTVI